MSREIRHSRGLLLIAAGVLVAGALLARWMVAKADEWMRADLLHQAGSIAQTISPERLSALAGTEADLHRPEYLRLKGQLQSVRWLYPRCRFVYLVGRDQAGAIYFYMDSEPADSEDCSPPGQVFVEAPAGIHGTFSRRTPVVEGPVTDRWGRWVSAYVPVLNQRSDELVAVLGLDVDAADWNRMATRAALPAIALTLALLGALLTGSAMLAHRSRTTGPLPWPMRHLEPALVIAAGLALTFFWSWWAYVYVSHLRSESFYGIAGSKTAAIVDALWDIRDRELEGLARFYEGSVEVTRDEYAHYVQHLLSEAAVLAWGWVATVPESQRGEFVAQTRSSGAPDFDIWQHGRAGAREPATGRDLYYPIVQLVPPDGSHWGIGFDLGSEGAMADALLVATETGLPTATVPIAAGVEEHGSQCMLLYRPVCDHVRDPRGFAVAILSLDRLVLTALPGSNVLVELSLLRDNGPPELITAPAAGPSARSQLSFSRPAFAFGRAFAVTARPGPGFRTDHPLRSCILVAIAGVLLTGAIAVIAETLLRRREALQWLVEERTSALRASEESMRALVDGIPDVVMRFGRDGRCLFASDNVRGWVDLMSHQLIGRTVRDLGLSEDQCRFWEESIRAVFDTGVPLETEFMVKTPRKGRVILNWRLVPEVDEPGSVRSVLTMARDVTDAREAETEQARLEAQLRQAQRMESVGRLAGGVAHDFNNMLGVMVGYTELAMAKLGPSHPVLADLQEVCRAAERSADLTRQLLAFARKQTVSPQVIDLNHAVSNMLRMLRRLVGEGIDVHWRPGPYIGPVHIDPAQLDQILANLCVNARDAIGDHGQIDIETDNATLQPEDCVALPGAKPGHYVLLRVTDDGCGMDEATLASIYEPFFTTKEVGKGTGLGLATVYGIVKQNGGLIYADSAPGQGSTFTIYLPCHTPVEGESTDSTPPRPPVLAEATILLVEDEPAILSVTTTMLERLGHTVLAASSPAEAMQLAQAYGGAIDLLMTDVIMPEMNGRELAEKLQSLHPELGCLYMSGYTANAIAHHGVLDEGVHFIAKPFVMRDLSAKVAEALGRG